MIGVQGEYLETAAPDLERLVTEHAGLVQRIAYHLVARLPESVDVNDLIQSGMLGLMEAAQRFVGGQGANFETYAGIRIRGAMIDELRRSDWAPRSVHRRAREMEQVMRGLEHRLGRSPDAQEMADAMGVTIEEYFGIARDAVACHVFSLDDLKTPEQGDTEALTGQPDLGLEQSRMTRALAEAIDHLPEREKLIMSLYYDEQLNLREIGEVLGVSESRVCQLHGQALVRVRAQLADWRA
ncbi:MAG: RNA polymerase sigma factor FliA [Wenzhouxiangellaceae bacterium]|nr:RNA polymerase sigma factor FliA [Wenzhouxiangellaceae bacterium]